MNMRKILDIETFDPLGVDVSFLNEVSSQIPEEGYMDPAMAEALATSTLRAADLCIDLLGQATLYLAHRDATRRAVKASVIKNLLSEKKPSTVVKEIFADDEDYIESMNKYNIALALHTWLENKYQALLKTHHLCKEFIRRSQPLQNASGWESSENSSQNNSFTHREDSTGEVQLSNQNPIQATPVAKKPKPTKPTKSSWSV